MNVYLKLKIHERDVPYYLQFIKPGFTEEGHNAYFSQIMLRGATGYQIAVRYPDAEVLESVAIEARLERIERLVNHINMALNEGALNDVDTKEG